MTGTQVSLIHGLGLSAVVLAFSTTIGAQPPTPATQPVRPPQRPPQGEPATRPMPESESDSSGTDRPRAPREGGDATLTDLTLKGCLVRADAKTYRLKDSAASDATVTDEVVLQGALEDLPSRVGKLIEVTGTFEQATPAASDPTFAVSKVRTLAESCDKPRP
ncbi:MAG: hypothetical protein ACR2LU_01590 [Luteitalea sp.]